MDDNTARPDYVNKAIRTECGYAAMPTAVGSVQLCRMLHASIGLCTETGELFEALYKPEFADHAKEEIGDLWWYVAILHSAMLKDLNMFIGTIGQTVPTYHTQAIAIAVGNIQDVIKRSLFYGKPVDHKRLDEQVTVLVANLILLGHSVGIRACDAMDANIAKLTARYPDKFTEEKAGDRNIEVERAALQ